MLVVVDRVGVDPVLVATRGAEEEEVQVREFRVVADNPVVLLGGVEVLYQVVPEVPYPDNAVVVRRVDLDEFLGPQQFLGELGGIAAGSDCLSLRLEFICNHHHVAVRQHDRVVVLAVSAV